MLRAEPLIPPLLQAEHESVRMLICALNDEISDVRLAIIKLLART